jgi:hypothetical protein
LVRGCIGIHPEPCGGVGIATDLEVRLPGSTDLVIRIRIATRFRRRVQAQSLCSANACNSQPGVDAWNATRTTGDRSTIAFVVGGAAAAGATAVWLLSRPSTGHPSVTQVGVGLGGLELRGAW